MKKASLFLLVVCMLFSLAACNSTFNHENWEYEIVQYYSFSNKGERTDSDGNKTNFEGTAQAACTDDMNQMAEMGWEVVDVELGKTDSISNSYVYVVTYRRPK